MPTRNVVLSNQQQTLIESLVESGRYQNASEVLREGLRLVERREAEDVARLEALRNAVGIGFEDIDAGHYVELGTEDLTAHIAALGVKADARLVAKG